MAASKKKAPKAKSTPKKKAGADKLYTGQVRELVELMVNNDLTSLEIVNGDLKVSLGRGFQGAAPVAAPAAIPAATPVAPPPAPADDDTDGLIEITSPMVGTFYSSPSPDSEEFAQVGARVTVDTVVCIIEAMKVMNEIKAEVSGTIAEIVVTNGQPVEYGQVLFRLKP